MPWKSEWVAPEMALQHKGVTVYHAYNGDDWEDKLTFWFTLSEREDGEEFDVRKLKTWVYRDEVSGNTGRIKQALKDAIDQGILKPKD